MSKFWKFVLPILALLVGFMSTFRIDVVENEGFVVLGSIFDSPDEPDDSFFTVYDVESGKLESVIYLGSGIVSGEIPEPDDHVFVRRFFVVNRSTNIFTEFVTQINKLPFVEHADPVPYRITITVNGEEVGDFENLEDVINDVIMPEIEK
jgi:hypothetical protein